MINNRGLPVATILGDVRSVQFCLMSLARMLPHRLCWFHEALTSVRAGVEIVDGMGRMVGGEGAE